MRLLSKHISLSLEEYGRFSQNDVVNLVRMTKDEQWKTEDIIELLVGNETLCKTNRIFYAKDIDAWLHMDEFSLF